LWNVLRGEMSLVGPRPERPEFAGEFLREEPLYRHRFVVKPGMTGLAQVHGRYDTDYRQKLRYDLVYIGGMSLGADLRIIAATLRSVLTARGAR
ncbi:MAG TPA: sugar transferase, partial [Candidatus Hydrogenedentes bacterium]|nr:sugar transferase [Candidatus Hydrogenedentota bacterium]